MRLDNLNVLCATDPRTKYIECYLFIAIIQTRLTSCWLIFYNFIYNFQSNRWLDENPVVCECSFFLSINESGKRNPNLKTVKEFKTPECFTKERYDNLTDCKGNFGLKILIVFAFLVILQLLLECISTFKSKFKSKRFA